MKPAASRALRIAMFSPAPPIPSGLSAYLLDLLPVLPDAWHIDVFTDDDVAADDCRLLDARSRPVGCFGHSRFERAHAEEPYDLNVYQVGNSRDRSYVFDYVRAYPGLLVLHDGVLHPGRVEAGIASADLHAYRRDLHACRPGAGAAVGHMVAAGMGSPLLYFTFPMCEDLVRASLVTGMHGELSCAWLDGLVPDATVVPLVHWRSVELDRQLRDGWRERLAPGGEVLLGSFGHIGAERRLDVALRALARLPENLARSWRLVIAGAVDPALRLERLVEELRLGSRVVFAPGLDDRDFVAVMGAVDVALNLRYPQVRASSGVLQQLLQLGVPAMITDVVHWRDYPDGAVLRVPPGPDEAESAALLDGLRRWIGCADTRRRAGVAASRWAARNITPEGARDSYVAGVERALEAPRGAAAR